MDEKRGTRLTHEAIYKGRIFTVERDRVRLPKGIEATMEVVRHPGSVVLLPMPDAEHVILVKQYRYAVDRWVWELAAGTLEHGRRGPEGEDVLARRGGGDDRPRGDHRPEDGGGNCSSQPPLKGTAYTRKDRV